MTSLVRFDQLKSAASAKQSEQTQCEEMEASNLIDRLRYRLVSADFRDSMEVKAAIIGELIYLCYKDLAKKRYLS